MEGWPDLVAPTRAEITSAVLALHRAGVAALAVDPAEVAPARDLLGTSPIAVVALVSAPLGAMTSGSRIAPAAAARLSAA